MRSQKRGFLGTTFCICRNSLAAKEADRGGFSFCSVGTDLFLPRRPLTDLLEASPWGTVVGDSMETRPPLFCHLVGLCGRDLKSSSVLPMDEKIKDRSGGIPEKEGKGTITTVYDKNTDYLILTLPD